MLFGFGAVADVAPLAVRVAEGGVGTAGVFTLPPAPTVVQAALVLI